MANKLMYIPNDYEITTFVDNRQFFKRLDTQPNEPTKENSIKVLKAFKPTKGKTIL